MKKYLLSKETLGYVTAEDETNASTRLLVAGSKNVLIDRNRKTKTRSGFTRLGAGNASLTPIRNSFTWHNSTGGELPLRFYDDEWEVYLATIDGVDVDAWARFANSMDTDATPRGATVYSTTEDLDLMILVQGDDNLYEWSGGVATIASATSNTITKNGSSTWAQNRFLTGGTTQVTINGTVYTYTGGEGTTTLTGVSPDPTGEAADSVAIQTVRTNANQPEANRNNHNIYSFQNQLVVGSDDSNEVFISSDTDFTDYTFSAPRVSGEGALLTLDAPAKAFGTLGSNLVVSAGNDSWFKAVYQQITVSTTLAETLAVEKLHAGVNQGAQNQETTIQLGNSIIFLSFEPAVRIISDPDELEGINPRTLSNPIKPDFDAEVWTNACAVWYKNAYYLSSPANSNLYILEFVEDADGKVRRFWNPPQVLPVRSFFVYQDLIYAGSNGVPETYKLFDGVSDYVANATIGTPGDKVPFNAVAAFAYNLYGDRANLKKFDEAYVDGEITSNTTDLLLTLNYDFGGQTQTVEKTIDGSDEDILAGNVTHNSLGQQSLGVNPLGGLLNAPDDARKFNIILEIAPDDFSMLQFSFSTNEIDRYWAIISYGTNASISPRRNIKIHK